MKVDLQKLILLLLPTSLRSKSVSEFIRSLLLQVQRTYDEFCLFLHDAKYRANADASVISLEHHIEREFDVPAKITELSGRPTDFLVTVDGNVDESRLRSLIDSYKLFGKSYVFKVAGVEYISEWMEHVCENMSVEYVSEWIGHVCENKEAVIISHTVHVDPLGFSIEVHSSKSVYSDVHFTVFVYYYPPQSQGIFQTAEASGVIIAGNSHATVYADHPENILPQTTSGISVSPGEDERYYYRAQGYNE
jgi:hypothetical protein